MLLQFVCGLARVCVRVRVCVFVRVRVRVLVRVRECVWVCVWVCRQDRFRGHVLDVFREIFTHFAVTGISKRGRQRCGTWCVCVWARVRVCVCVCVPLVAKKGFVWAEMYVLNLVYLQTYTCRKAIEHVHDSFGCGLTSICCTSSTSKHTHVSTNYNLHIGTQHQIFGAHVCMLSHVLWHNIYVTYMMAQHICHIYDDTTYMSHILWHNIYVTYIMTQHICHIYYDTTYMWHICCVLSSFHKQIFGAYICMLWHICRVLFSFLKHMCWHAHASTLYIKPMSTCFVCICNGVSHLPSIFTCKHTHLGAQYNIYMSARFLCGLTLYCLYIWYLILQTYKCQPSFCAGWYCIVYICCLSSCKHIHIRTQQTLVRSGRTSRHIYTYVAYQCTLTCIHRARHTGRLLAGEMCMWGIYLRCVCGTYTHTHTWHISAHLRTYMEPD